MRLTKTKSSNRLPVKDTLWIQYHKCFESKRIEKDIPHKKIMKKKGRVPILTLDKVDLR